MHSFPIAILALAMVSLPVPAAGQGTKGVPRTSELFRTVESLDKQMFDAYNACDLEKFKSLLADDVEFYHDQSGLMHGADNVVVAVKNNICGKVRRDVTRSTIEVHEMRGYGAIQMGVHRFFEIKVDPDRPSGEARFIHLWRNQDGVWKVTRILSFDHRGLKD